jgi:hypothetical protein
MKIDEIFQSKYLKVSDLPEDSALPVTIRKVAVEEIGMERDRKPVIYFQDLEKSLVLNKTNAKTIAKLTGSGEMDDWVGTTIYLYRAEVEFQGETVEAIRVKLKPTAPQSKAVDSEAI